MPRRAVRPIVYPGGHASHRALSEVAAINTKREEVKRGREAVKRNAARPKAQAEQEQAADEDAEGDG